MDRDSYIARTVRCPEGCPGWKPKTVSPYFAVSKVNFEDLALHPGSASVDPETAAAGIRVLEETLRFAEFIRYFEEDRFIRVYLFRRI